MTDRQHAGEAELSAALSRLAEPPEVGAGTSRGVVAAVDRRRRRRTGLIAAAAAAVIVVGVAVAGVLGGQLLSDDDPQPAKPAPTVPAPSQDDWAASSRSDLDPRSTPSVLAGGGLVYVLGGQSPALCDGRPCAEQEVYGDGQVYDPADDSWTPVDALPGGASIADATLAGDRPVVGGIAAEGSQDATYRYDDGSWQRIGDLPDGVRLRDVAAWDGSRLYTLDGTTVWSLDPEQGEQGRWRDDELPPVPFELPQGVSNAGVLVATDDGLALVWQGGGATARVARWSDGDDAWEELDDIPAGAPLGGGAGVTPYAWADGRLISIPAEGGTPVAVDLDTGESTELTTDVAEPGCAFPAFGAAGQRVAATSGVLSPVDGSTAIAGPGCPGAVTDLAAAVWTGTDVVGFASDREAGALDLGRAYRWTPGG